MHLQWQRSALVLHLRRVLSEKAVTVFPFFTHAQWLEDQVCGRCSRCFWVSGSCVRTRMCVFECMCDFNGCIHFLTDPPHPRSTTSTKERRRVDLYLSVYIKAVPVLSSVCMCVVKRYSCVSHTKVLCFYLWAAQGQPGKRRQRHPGWGSEGGWKSLVWSPATRQTLEGTGTCAAPSHYRTLVYPPTAWTWERNSTG